MIIDKEYPATHSMSTAWYMIDEDGNVGIMDFNDNGPVPYFLEENAFEYLLYSAADANAFNLTEEQIFDTIKGPLELTVENLEFDKVIRIDMRQQHVFEECISKYFDDDVLCINKDTGLYFTSLFIDEKKKAELNELINKKVVLELFEIQNYWMNDLYNNEEIHFEKCFKSAPYYIYYQPYWTNFPQERMYIPHNLVKEEQLTETVRETAIRISGRFSEMPQMQILQYCFCNSQDFEEPKVVNGFVYGLFPISRTQNAYCIIEDVYEEHVGKDRKFNFFTSEPRLLILSTKDKKPNFTDKSDFWGLRRNSMGIVIEKEDNINILLSRFASFKPYAILCIEDIDVSTIKLEIDGEEVPVFRFNELEYRLDELKRLISQPYRGARHKQMLTVEEMQELEDKGLAKPYKE